MIEAGRVDLDLFVAHGRRDEEHRFALQRHVRLRLDQLRKLGVDELEKGAGVAVTGG